MSDILIRNPRTGDGEGLAQTWRDAGAYYASLAPELCQVPDENGLADWLEEPLLGFGSEDTRALVAEQSGQVVGFVTATIERPRPDVAKQLLRDLARVRVNINALAVRETHRRQGVGTKLMDAIEEWARQQGATVALLDTYSKSPLSMPFYEQRMEYSRHAVRFRKVLVEAGPNSINSDTA